MAGESFQHTEGLVAALVQWHGLSFLCEIQLAQNLANAQRDDLAANKAAGER